jgi:predicted DNA-binding protein (MmcQ/YjbR family)
MNVEDVRDYCLSLPFVEEYTPFGEDILVFKVGGIEQGKIFSLLPISAIPARVNLKCDPLRAEELREQYAQILPGYHMNKKHWNTVYYEDDLPPKLTKELIQHSYTLVYASLPLKLRKELESL